MSNGVTWGKVLAGAGIAAGAVAVLAFNPTIATSLLSAVETAASWTYDKAGDAVGWVWDKLVGNVDVAATEAAHAAGEVSTSIDKAVTASAGIPSLTSAMPIYEAAQEEAAAVATELGKVAAEKNTGVIGNLLGFMIENKALAIGAGAAAGGVIAAGAKMRHGHKHDRHSFAMQEDMRRMQALMQARMAATGYAPAMAMGGMAR